MFTDRRWKFKSSHPTKSKLHHSMDNPLDQPLSDLYCYVTMVTVDIPDIMTMEVTTEGRGCAPRGMVDDSIYDAEICKRFDDIPGLIEMFPSMDEDSMTFGMESMGDSSVDVHGSLCVCDGGSCKEGGGSDKPNRE